MLNFYLIFPTYQNFHWNKDVGCIPRFISKHGHNATIACNGDYENLEGVIFKKIKEYTKLNTLNSLIHVYKNKKNIDVLNLYHMCLFSLIISITMRLLRSVNLWHGVVYLKLDASNKFYDRLKNSRTSRIVRLMLRSFDYVSCEIATEVNTFGNNDRFFHIPNDIDPEFYNIINSKNILSSHFRKRGFVCVARHGTDQKNSKELIEGYEVYCNNSDCIVPLNMIGDMTDEFRTWLYEKMKANKNLSENVKILGSVSNRDQLINYYLDSHCLVLTSKWEGYPIVLREASSLGLIAIMSNTVLAAPEVFTDHLHVYPLGNIDELANAFTLMEDKNKGKGDFINRWPEATKEIIERVLC